MRLQQLTAQQSIVMQSYIDDGTKPGPIIVADIAQELVELGLLTRIADGSYWPTESGKIHLRFLTN